MIENEHVVELVTSILQNASFHDKHIGLKVPLPGNNMTLSLLINRVTTQITADVCQDGKVLYCGVHAADMKSPMCPVYKH
jgi:hypothetical protein